MSTKDSLFMQNKDMSLCEMCKYSVFNINVDGWNCSNKESVHFTTDWDLLVGSITDCEVFVFAVPIFQKIIENEEKERAAKAQTVLECF